MRVLVDTNVLISRENHTIVPDALQKLLSVLQKDNTQILLHPLSIEEIEKDRNQERKRIILSKIGTYPLLEDPPNPTGDHDYLETVGAPCNNQEIVDNNLLYCVQKNSVDFLITEDKGIHRKSERLEISHRVFNIDESLAYFQSLFLDRRVLIPPALEYGPVFNLDFTDPFFDSLMEEYAGFEDWWKKICRQGRKAWSYRKPDGFLGAFLLCKKEKEAIASNPPLPARQRIKICTLKVTHLGHKMGELFVKISLDFAIKNDIHEIYLTHFPKPQDYLTALIEEFGFYLAAKKNGEDIYVKKLIPDRNLESPREANKRFYPSFYDGVEVKKFVVPIRPQYHNKLFTECWRRQTSLPEYEGQFIIEGNTIKKAYLCHSRIKKISCGDILLFYRSRDERALTSLGVVEEVHHDVRDSNEVLRYVGKRTVYNNQEIQDMVKKPTKVIIFKWHFHMSPPLKFKYLQQSKILSTPPQSIREIPHNKYLQIRKEGGIDERFTLN